MVFKLRRYIGICSLSGQSETVALSLRIESRRGHCEAGFPRELECCHCSNGDRNRKRVEQISMKKALRSLISPLAEGALVLFARVAGQLSL